MNARATESMVGWRNWPAVTPPHELTCGSPHIRDKSAPQTHHPSKKQRNRGSHIERQQNPRRKTKSNLILLPRTQPRAAMSGSSMRNKRACSQSKNPPPCTNISNGQHRNWQNTTCTSIAPNAGYPRDVQTHKHSRTQQGISVVAGRTHPKRTARGEVALPLAQRL